MRQIWLKGVIQAHAGFSSSILCHLAVVSQRNDEQRIAAASTKLSAKPAMIYDGPSRCMLLCTGSMRVKAISCKKACRHSLGDVQNAQAPHKLVTSLLKQVIVGGGGESSQGSADAVAAECDPCPSHLCVAQEECGIAVCKTHACTLL